MGPRHLLRSLVVLLVVLVAAGCSTDDDPDQGSSRTDAPDTPATTVEEDELEEGDVDEGELELEEVEDSGVTGTVRIEPGEGDAFDIDVRLDADDSGTHGIEARMGSCAEALDPGAAQELLEDASSYTLADIEDGEMRDSAKLPEDIVSQGTYSLVVYDGPDVEGDIAACVDVEVE